MEYTGASREGCMLRQEDEPISMRLQNERTTCRGCAADAAYTVTPVVVSDRYLITYPADGTMHWAANEDSHKLID
ncbi:MAG: hypothetical protein ACLVKR_04760 [Lachnospiraceae bacterium]